MAENEVRVKKSVTRNAMLNIIKTVMSLAFPLITFPYSARVLGLTAVGKYNFASSIVSYFTLLAALGFTMYAVREGSKYRDNQKDIDEFSSEVFSINIYSMLFACLLLLISILFIDKLKDYTILLLIFGFRIVLNTIGVNWVFTIFEDFTFPAIASCIMEVLSISIMLLFVHSPEDLYIYAISSVIAYNGAHLLMFLNVGRYVNLRFIPKPPIKHLKPILIIFSLELGMSIYVNSDLTILGWMEGDDAAGLYSTAATIYRILKQILNAIITVVLPRIAYHVSKEKEAKDAEGYEVNHKEVVDLSNLLVNTLVTLALPMMVGIYALAEPIVTLFAGPAFQNSAEPLQLLSVAIIFAVLSTFFGESILMAYKQEKEFMKATAISAVINIVLNLLLIPHFHINAAAYTTIVAEMFMLVYTYIEARKHVRTKVSGNVLISSVIGCIAIYFICMGVKTFIDSSALYILVSVVISMAVYFVVLLLFRNDALRELLKFKN